MDWKIEFYPKKSFYTCFGPKSYNQNIEMNHSKLPFNKNFIYLGFPIGDQKFSEEFVEMKFKKLEKSFYSLYSLGCQPCGLNPMTTSFIYKQYCQSILKYGLEFVFITKRNLESVNIRQNILIKRSIGLSKFVKTTPLFNCLKIESIKQIYMKHKIFAYNQLQRNQTTKELFREFKVMYDIGIIAKSNQSLFKQLEDISKEFGLEYANNSSSMIKVIDNLVKCTNTGLVDSVKFLIVNLNSDNQFSMNIKLLTNLLKY